MIQEITKGDETISITLTQVKNITGLDEEYSLDGGSVAEAANLSLRMAKNIIIAKLGTNSATNSATKSAKLGNKQEKIGIKSVKGYDINENPKDIYAKTDGPYSIYADDQQFTKPAIIGFSKNIKKDPIYSFTDKTFVLFYKGKPIPEITTRTEVAFLNRPDVIDVYGAAVNYATKQKGTRPTAEEVKYTLITPLMVKAILDSAGFGSVIPLSITDSFGFSNFDIIK